MSLQGRSLDDFWHVPVENASLALIGVRDDGTLVLREACVVGHLHDVRADTAAQAL